MISYQPVALNLACTVYEFSDENNLLYAVTYLVLEIRWRLRINDVESNFLHCRSAIMDTLSVNLLSRENSFWGLAKCSEAAHNHALM